MKKLIGAIFAITILNCGLAHADQVTVNFSGDNNISYWNGSSWVASGNDWQNPVPFTFNDNHLSNVSYIAVSNDYTLPNSGYDGGSNPAGFAASFTDITPGGTFVDTATNTLLSNVTDFKVLAVNPWNTPVVYPAIPTTAQYNPPSSLDPTTLSGWGTATSYGLNTAGDSIWASVNGGPVGSIDPNAEWLWTARNSGSYASMDDYTIYQFDLGVTDGTIGGGNGNTVPEPPTALLFVFAGALVFFFNRRKILKVA